MKYLSVKERLIVWIICAFLTSIAVVGMPASAQAAVRSCTSSTPVASRPVLVYGDTGSCVIVAQSLLINKGYSVGSSGADGSFGPKTLAAVKLFQSQNGLVQDGSIGPLTWSKLAGATSAPPPPPASYNIYLGPNSTSRVILTYDDCPKSLTAMKTMVLAAQKSNVGLVLAPTGDCVRSGRFDAAYARAHGQYVINHSVSHPDLTTLSYTKVLAQLSAPGIVTNYGRPPYGSYNTTVKNAYAEKGMRMWLWNVDTRDWEGKTQTSVVNYVNRYATARSTVLMHMQWNGFTPSALASIKSGLNARGLGVCRAYAGTTPVKLPNSLPC